MSISIEWFAIPCAAAVLCCWACLRYWADPREEDGYCPPYEVPIVAIKARYGKVAQEHAGVYEVAFKTTGADRFFWLTAPEIIKRCQQHHQKIPFLIAYDDSVVAKIPLNLGDTLLIN